MIHVATLHANGLATCYTESVLRAGLTPRFYPANPNTICERRNDAARDCLDSDAQWLLFIDSDMGFAPDSLPRLLESADPADRPVVGALCFGLQQRHPDGMGGFDMKPFPTIFDFNGSTFGIRWDYPRDTLTQVAATGCAFLLIHRDVLAKMRAESGDTWFDRARIGAELLGEDLSFCVRAGVPIHVHTGVKTNHHKASWVSETTYIGARAAAALVERKLRS